MSMGFPRVQDTRESQAMRGHAPKLENSQTEQETTALAKIAELRPETSSSTNVAQESALPPRIGNCGYKKPAHTEEYKRTPIPT
ncbi:hypothetical protein HPB49_024801 [Dermacentor silvarum]|uniref:Uncharacterized protein n=1 Tax=Dermacentor silvarum TaxID=543639 RepID=A0ACB8D8Z1_DERSI|nr:hypothetical protein HPB49_024801 [Dermacentor silvarum]